MNNFFKPTRFGRLLRAHWAEKWREYAWFVAVLAMLDVVALVIVFVSVYGSGLYPFQFRGQAQWYMMGLFCSGVIFAARYFRQMPNPGASLILLMRPASVFEKWLMAFLVIGVFYPLAYTLLYVLLNYPVVQLAESLAPALSTCKECTFDFRFYFPLLTADIAETVEYSDKNSFRSQVFFFILLSAAQELIAGGMVFFKNSPVLKTVLGTFLLFSISMGMSFFPQMGIFEMHYGISAIEYNALDYVVSIGLWLGLPALLWVALYFHLKEREVA